MSTIIFLNGCGSSGKSSIAKNIQQLSNKPWLHLEMDMFINMMPEQYIDLGDKAQSGYFSFASGMNEFGPTMSVEEGPLGKCVFGAIPYIAKILADFSNDLIIDEVLLDEASFNKYVEQLKGHTVYFIGVYCDLKMMQEREIARGDRVVGLSNDQMNRVHLNQIHYDLKVDTTHKSAFLVAKEILTFIAGLEIKENE